MMMDEWRHIKKRPVFKNKNRLYSNLMGELDKNETVKPNRKMMWWKAAASVLVILSIGSYSWLQINTFLSRSKFLAKKQKAVVEKRDLRDCHYQVNELLASLQDAGFIIDDLKNEIEFSRQSVNELRKNNSMFYSDVIQFLEVMKNMYPVKFQQYTSGECVSVNAWHLKNDKRICQWVK